MIKVPLPRVLTSRGFQTRGYDQGLQLGSHDCAPVIVGNSIYPCFPLIQPRSGNNGGGLAILPKGNEIGSELLLANREDLNNCGIFELFFLDTGVYLAGSSAGSGSAPEFLMLLMPKFLPGGSQQLGDSDHKWSTVWTDELRGVLKSKTRTYLSSSDLSTEDHYVNAQASSSDTTLHLPDPRQCEGKEIVVKKTGGSYNVIVDVASGDDIDGQSSVTISSLYESYTFYSRYGHWAIKAHHTP